MYRLTIETDFDFSFKYKGKLYADYRIVLSVPSVKDLDDIVLQGPLGSPGVPEKRWEFDEAMEAIRKNPEELFCNLGGNRGVEWYPISASSGVHIKTQRDRDALAAQIIELQGQLAIMDAALATTDGRELAQLA